MNYFIVRPETTVGTMKRSCEEDEQRVFPVVNPDNSFLGLIYAEDFRNCEDSDTASLVLEQAQKWDDRDVYVLTTQPVTEAKELMRRWKIQFVPVVDRDHGFIGTIDDAT